MHVTQAEVSVLVLLDGARAVVGTHSGVLTLYKRNEGPTVPQGEEPQWARKATVTLHEDVMVDSMQKLSESLVLACCAGYITAHSTTDWLKSASVKPSDFMPPATAKSRARTMSSAKSMKVEEEGPEDDAVATHCTGAFCFHTGGAWAPLRKTFRGFEAQSATSHRLCVAQHGRLALLTVEEVAASNRDARGQLDVTAADRRAQLFVREESHIPLSDDLQEEPLTLHWSDGLLCMAYRHRYVILAIDSANGRASELWLLPGLSQPAPRDDSGVVLPHELRAALSRTPPPPEPEAPPPASDDPLRAEGLKRIPKRPTVAALMEAVALDGWDLDPMEGEVELVEVCMRKASRERTLSATAGADRASRANRWDGDGGGAEGGVWG